MTHTQPGSGVLEPTFNFLSSVPSDKFIGQNVFAGNTGNGVNVTRSSYAYFGDSGFGIPNDNTITGNGRYGVVISAYSSVDMTNVTVAGTTGYYGVYCGFPSSYFGKDASTSISGGTNCP